MTAEAASPPRPIGFTEVTPRDGEQQIKIKPVMDIPERIAVFDEIVSTGIDRVEIGHLGNEHDVKFARALVGHVNERSESGDERYANVSLQVLFDTRSSMEEGLAAIEDFDPDRVVVHVYDRVSPNLRRLAEEPYTTRESAERVINASQAAIDRGYTNFSVSGEGTVDPDLPMDEALDDFYLPIIDSLRENGATSININLPNTFGSSLVGEWDETGLEIFNAAIKERDPEATTSVHVHNDHNSANEYAVAAIRAGFDRVEGTNGMGERAGNVALPDVMVLLLESARSVVENRSHGRRRVGHAAVRLWEDRYLEEGIVSNLGNWYGAARQVSTIYGTMNRFHQTSLGNKEAYGAGSGPHAHANRELLRDPVANPLWKNYGRSALIHAMLGRPEAWQIIEVDPDRIRDITLETHAAGGSTVSVREERVEPCSDEARAQAIQEAEAMMERIVRVVSGGAAEAVEAEAETSAHVQLAAVA